jgi:amino acid transporter
MSKLIKDKLGFWEVTSIGVGGMVGGGIFAVLGLSVELTKGGAPVAFLIAGSVALVTSYSYARLSVTYPSQGGTVTFLDRAFGSGLLTGSANILLWISYIVMLSLYAYAFGIWGVDKNNLTLSAWSSPLHLIAGGMIIFLAYEGFELIANTAQDVRNASKTLPRAFYASVIFVIVLYVLVAVVAVGSLPVNKILGAKDYALAEAARPSLGQTGFLLITIAAMLSTASAINATIYGAARLSYAIAKDGELPSTLERKAWGKPIEGLMITTGVTLLIANLSDLSSMSMIGSTGFLLIFATVNGANVALAKETHSKRFLSLIGVGLCVGAIGSLIWQTVNSSPAQLWFLLMLTGGAFFIETSFRLITGRTVYFSKAKKKRTFES